MSKKEKMNVEELDLGDDLDLDELMSDLEDLDLELDVDGIDLGDEEEPVEAPEETDDTEEEEEQPVEEPAQPKKKRGRPKKQKETPPPAPAQNQAVSEADMDDPKTLLLSAIRVQSKVISMSSIGGEAKQVALEQLKYVEGLIDLLL